MYYEEKVVNGVLCFRVTPNGDWQPMSVTELTGRVVFAEKKLHAFDQTRAALEYYAGTAIGARAVAVLEKIAAMEATS